MIWEELQGELDALQRDGLKRTRRTLELPCGPQAQVDGQPLISFCSNDYLGLANDPALVEAACAGARAWGVGSGASHLVSGHLGAHAVLEQKLAEFTGFARALLFSTGYLANLGIVPALVGRTDAVFADRLNHASLIDAVQLSRADSQRYAHGDLAALERLLGHGVLLRPFSSDLMKAARETSRAMLEEQAAQDATYRKVYESWSKAREGAFRWFGTAELAYTQFAFGP